MVTPLIVLAPCAAPVLIAPALKTTSSSVTVAVPVPTIVVDAEAAIVVNSDPKVSVLREPELPPFVSIFSCELDPSLISKAPATLFATVRVVAVVVSFTPSVLPTLIVTSPAVPGDALPLPPAPPAPDASASPPPSPVPAPAAPATRLSAPPLTLLPSAVLAPPVMDTAPPTPLALAPPVMDTAPPAPPTGAAPPTTDVAPPAPPTIPSPAVIVIRPPGSLEPPVAS